MALKKGHEIATIDVCLVTVTTSETTPREIGLTTATQIQVDPQIETTEAIKLIIKAILVAQKREKQTITGNQITLADNVFNPELVQIIQGGTITTGADGKITSYTPPVAGSNPADIPVFTLNAYSAQYDASGLIVQYEKISYPNCTGNPISMSAQDDVFRVSEYTIISAPAQGEAPYTITYVDTLPAVADAD